MESTYHDEFTFKWDFFLLVNLSQFPLFTWYLLRFNELLSLCVWLLDFDVTKLSKPEEEREIQAHVLTHAASCVQNEERNRCRKIAWNLPCSAVMTWHTRKVWWKIHFIALLFYHVAIFSIFLKKKEKRICIRAFWCRMENVPLQMIPCNTFGL